MISTAMHLFSLAISFYDFDFFVKASYRKQRMQTLLALDKGAGDFGRLFYMS